MNRGYLRRLRHSLVTGSSPPDSPPSSREAAYRARATLDNLPPSARAMMGWPQDRTGQHECRTTE